MNHNLAIKCSKRNNSLLEELHKLADMKHKLNPQPSRLIIAKNMKALRDAKQLSQSALAKMAGVSQRTVSNIENVDSEANPTTDSVEAVASVFGLELFHNSALNILLRSGHRTPVVEIPVL